MYWVKLNLIKLLKQSLLYKKRFCRLGLIHCVSFRNERQKQAIYRQLNVTLNKQPQ